VMVFVSITPAVLCELAQQQRPSVDVITHLLWCLANHKMSCSASMVTAHVSVSSNMCSCEVL